MRRRRRPHQGGTGALNRPPVELGSVHRGCGVSTMRLASAIAFALATVLGEHNSVAAFHHAFAASIVFALLGIAFALRIHDEDAAASMRRSPHITATLVVENETR